MRDYIFDAERFGKVEVAAWTTELSKDRCNQLVNLDYELQEGMGKHRTFSEYEYDTITQIINYMIHTEGMHEGELKKAIAFIREICDYAQKVAEYEKTS